MTRVSKVRRAQGGTDLTKKYKYVEGEGMFGVGRAKPTKSLFSPKRYGIAFSWMGVGASNPSSCNDFSTSLFSPSSSNVILCF